MFRIALQAVFLALTSFILIACDNSAVKPRVYHVSIAGHEYWVPEAYFTRFKPSGFEVTGMGLGVIYPEFTPLSQSGYEHDRERWFDDVRITVHELRSSKTNEELLESTKRQFGATHHSGERMGMPFYTSPPDATETDHNEIYVFQNDESVIGHLRCSSEQTYPNPQCKAQFWMGDIYIRIAFDKDLLNYWSSIEEKTFSLLNDFKNPESKEISNDNTHTSRNK